MEDNNNNKANQISSSFTTGDVTSVKPGLTINQINVYPNPGNGLFRIQILEGKPTHLKVTDLNGRIVHDTTINGNNIYIIDLRNYPDGFYILNIEVYGYPSRQVFKLVKQHG